MPPTSPFDNAPLKTGTGTAGAPPPATAAWPQILLAGTPVAIILLLATAGGGIWAWTVAMAAIAGWAVILIQKPAILFPAPLQIVCIAAMALILLSLLPLPLPLTRLTGAERYQQNDLAAHAIKNAADAGLTSPAFTTFSATRNRAGTLRIGLLLAAAAAAFALTASLPWKSKRYIARFLTCMGLVIAALGLISLHVLPQGDRLWWWIPIPHNLPGPVACFANRNHYAGFAAITTVAALTLALASFHARRLTSALLWGGAFCAAFAAVILSLSRGAWIACACGCAITAVLGPYKSRWVKCLYALLTALLVAGVAVVALRSPQVSERLDTLKNPLTTESAKIRLPAWKDGLRIWTHHWFAGCGANGFRMVYPQFKSTAQRAFMTYPENVYVQCLAETGLCGLAIAAIAGWFIAKAIRQRFADPATRLYGSIAAGTGGVALIHGCVDVPTLVPLYSVVLACYAGLSIAPALPSPEPVARPRSRWFPAIMLACAASMGLFALPAQRLDNYARFSAADTAFIARSLIWAPTSSQSWLHLGRRAIATGTATGYRNGEQWMLQAATYDPMNYPLWKEICLLRLHLGNTEGARAAYARVKELRPWVSIPELDRMEAATP